MEASLRSIAGSRVYLHVPRPPEQGIIMSASSGLPGAGAVRGPPLRVLHGTRKGPLVFRGAPVADFRLASLA